MDVSISVLKEKDLDDCAAVFSDVFSLPPWNEEWSRHSARQRIRTLYKGSSAVGFKASIKEKVCGFLIGETEQWNDFQLFLIKELCVDASYQRKGIGRRLIETLMDQLRNGPVKKVYLLTEQNSSAKAFYESLGFEENEKIVVMGKTTTVRS